MITLNTDLFFCCIYSHLLHYNSMDSTPLHNHYLRTCLESPQIPALGWPQPSLSKQQPQLSYPPSPPPHLSSRRPRVSDGEEASDATFPVRSREDGKDGGELVVGAGGNRFASPASGTTVGGGGGHWTASQFGRKGSEE